MMIYVYVFASFALIQAAYGEYVKRKAKWVSSVVGSFSLAFGFISQERSVPYHDALTMAAGLCGFAAAVLYFTHTEHRQQVVVERSESPWQPVRREE